MPSQYFPVQRNQTELDLSDIKSEGPVALKNSQIVVDRDKNQKFTERGLEILSWGKINLHDEEQVYQRISKYFDDCQQKSIKPTVSALAFSLRISREMLYRFVRGDAVVERNYSPEIVSMIRDAYQMLDVLWEDYMMNGQVNPASGIFLGKNHFGYRDIVDYTISPGSSAAPPSPAELSQKYEQLPTPEDDIFVEDS